MIIAIISLLLENFFNIFFNHTNPLFTLLSLIFLYYYFRKQRKKYFIFSFVMGFIYDLFFTNFLILNSLLFLFISVCIYYVLSTHKNDFIHMLLTSIFIIFLYNFFNVVILNFFNYTNYSILDFSFILRKFILVNIIYTIFLYLIIKKEYY